MRFLILILFCFIVNCSVAQEFADKEYYLIDSLIIDELISSDKQLLENAMISYHNAKDDTSKVVSLNPIVENMISDYWKNYQFFQYNLVQNILANNPDSKTRKKLKGILLSIYGNLAVIKAGNGDYDGAKEYYFKITTIPDVDSTLLATTYSNLAYIYDLQADLKNAIKLYFKAIKIQEAIDHKKGLAISYNNLGVLYNTQEEYGNALKYYKKAEKLRLKIKDIDGLGNTYNNIATIYNEYDSLDLALDYYKKSLKYREQIKDNVGLANVYNNIGTLYMDKGKEEKALEYFTKAQTIVKQINNELMYLSTNFNLSSLYENKNNLDEAKKLSLDGLDIAKQKGIPLYINKFSKSLYSIYEKKQNYKNALIMYKLHIKMRDSLKNEENTKELVQQQAKYEYEKQKAIDDAEHEKQIAIEQEAAEKQTIITYATTGGLGLVGIFLLVVFNRLKVTRKQKNIIEEQKQEVEQQKQVVELAHSELEEKNKEITDSIQYAKRIQNAILPPAKVVKEYLQESFIYYKPKDIVAGDFYWMETVSDEGGVMSDENPTLNTHHSTTVLFAAADCTGHGVPGAMVSVVCNNGLNRSVREHKLTDPGEILDKTREIVVAEFEKSEEEVKDGMDIALCSLQLNSPFEGEGRGMTLKYAGAHNPLWIIRGGELLETKANKQPIGKFDNPEPYTTHTLELQKGDSLYIFSDGYADQFGGEKGKKLKTINFKKLLISIQKETMEKQKQLIDEAFENWKGNLEQLDDVCVIGVKV